MTQMAGLNCSARKEAKMDYGNMTQYEFDTILAEIIKENAWDILYLPNVYEILSEHFNNEVLDRYENNPELND